MRRSLARCTRAATALTVTQTFLGAVSLGIAMFRGTEVYTDFHYESVLGHANHGASKLAADHARAANVVVNDNVIMTAMMGPRFAVEADKITMDGNAAIACPTCPKSPKCEICRQYQETKPRALAKLLWIRARQLAVWGSLGKLSGDIDRLASLQAGSTVTSDLERVDPRVAIRFEDPSRSRDIWGGANAATSCRLAAKEAIVQPALGHAFPVLIRPNLLEGLPRVLVLAFPQILCAATDALAEPTIELSQIKSVADQTRDECQDLEDQMQCAVAASMGRSGACQGFAASEVSDLARGKRVTLPSEVEPFVRCQRATLENPLQATGGGGYSYRDGSGKFVTCTFDRDRCRQKRLRENSDAFVRKALGVSKVVTDVAATLGGSETRAPTLAGPNGSPDFCACAYTSRPINETVIGISDAVRKIASFGAAGPSEALREPHDYRSCGKWYFPDAKGEFAAVPPDEQPFVAAWKWSLVARCPGGGGGG